MSEARSAILEHIRRAIFSGGSAAADADWQQIPRDYRIASALGKDELVELLEDRLVDYGARVLRTNLENVRAGVSELLAKRGVRRLLIPPGIPESWLPRDCDFVPDNDLSYDELDRIGAVLTGATLAIAETGTLILQAAAGQGRRALTLVPDYHLCVITAEQLIATVPQAMRLLEATAALPTTFCSGPSATADIEMTRIEGVHGPRSLDVLVLVGQ